MFLKHGAKNANEFEWWPQRDPPVRLFRSATVVRGHSSRGLTRSDADATCGAAQRVEGFLHEVVKEPRSLHNLLP